MVDLRILDPVGAPKETLRFALLTPLLRVSMTLCSSERQNVPNHFPFKDNRRGRLLSGSAEARTACLAAGLGFTMGRPVRELILSDHSDVLAFIEPSPHLVLECCRRCSVAEAAGPDDDDAPAHGF